MGRLFALADLHLSTSGHKPMDVFGELWLNHAERMRDRWDALVEPQDTVLLPGDLSWGRNLREAAGDLAWIGERPGLKVLLRGNHDGWWTSRSRVLEALPEGCSILQNDAISLGDRVVVGTRGWTDPRDPIAVPGDKKIFTRELERLRLSVAFADRKFGRELPRLAMLHYPPLLEGRRPSDVVGVLKSAGVHDCVYGHLHGDDHRLAVNGIRDGIHYHFVAADAVEFTPVEIPLPAPASGTTP